MSSQKTWESARETYRLLEKQRPYNTGLNINQAMETLNSNLEKARFVDWFCNPSEVPRVLECALQRMAIWFVEGVSDFPTRSLNGTVTIRISRNECGRV